MELSLRRLLPTFAWPSWAWTSSENQTKNESTDDETSNKDEKSHDDETKENTDEIMEVDDAIQVAPDHEKNEPRNLFEKGLENDIWKVFNDEAEKDLFSLNSGASVVEIIEIPEIEISDKQAIVIEKTEEVVKVNQPDLVGAVLSAPLELAHNIIESCYNALEREDEKDENYESFIEDSDHNELENIIEDSDHNELETIDAELTEEEWFASVAEDAEKDVDKLPQDLLDSMLANVLGEMEVDVSMYSLSDGEDPEGEEENDDEEEKEEEEEVDNADEDEKKAEEEEKEEDKNKIKIIEVVETQAPIEKHEDVVNVDETTSDNRNELNADIKEVEAKSKDESGKGKLESITQNYFEATNTQVWKKDDIENQGTISQSKIKSTFVAKTQGVKRPADTSNDLEQSERCKRSLPDILFDHRKPEAQTLKPTSFKFKLNLNLIVVVSVQGEPIEYINDIGRLQETKPITNASKSTRRNVKVKHMNESEEMVDAKHLSSIKKVKVMIKKLPKRRVMFGRSAGRVSAGGTAEVVRVARGDGSSRHLLHLRARQASIKETGC